MESPVKCTTLDGQTARVREQSHNDVGREEERNILQYRHSGYNKYQNQALRKYTTFEGDENETRVDKTCTTGSF